MRPSHIGLIKRCQCRQKVQLPKFYAQWEWRQKVVRESVKNDKKFSDKNGNYLPCEMSRVQSVLNKMWQPFDPLELGGLPAWLMERLWALDLWHSTMTQRHAMRFQTVQVYIHIHIYWHIYRKLLRRTKCWHYLCDLVQLSKHNWRRYENLHI